MSSTSTDPMNVTAASTIGDELEGWNRPPVIETEGDGELLEVAMGPHHPSTHGVFRMDVVLDGERVIRLKPVFGYLHRNHEQLAQSQTYLASMPYTDRLDYFCSLTNNWAYALAVEKLVGQEVPERAEYIRVILAELTRIQNHASTIGFLLQEMGASGTPLMYAFREREKILDLFESLTRLAHDVQLHALRRMPGGCCRRRGSMRARKVVAGLPQFIDEFENFLMTNEILMARCQGMGVLRPELAVNAGISGPMLRGSGVNYDIRKVDHYGIYDRFKFRVPLGDHGDIYDRYMVRMLEMRESVAILEQALKEVPGGPVMDPKAKIRGISAEGRARPMVASKRRKANLVFI